MRLRIALEVSSLFDPVKSGRKPSRDMLFDTRNISFELSALAVTRSSKLDLLILSNCTNHHDYAPYEPALLQVRCVKDLKRATMSSRRF
jgi:hypothetical protein